MALGSIFLFKNRKLQIKLGIFAFIAILLGLVLTVVLFIQDPIMEQDAMPGDGWGIIFPVVAMVAILIAQRYIRKDENLVQSMDRLR